MSNTKPQDHAAAPRQDVVSPHAVVGQISATQTMVVTTTTTTTTSFPPLLLNPPKHLDDMDPKQYPLAASSTPTSIKKLCFDVEGRTTTFEEARDVKPTLGNVCISADYFFRVQQGRAKDVSLQSSQQLQQLSKTRTSLAAAPRTDGESKSLETPLPSASPIPALETPGTSRTPRIFSGIKRPASPVSISEAATRASQEGPRKKRIVIGTTNEPLSTLRSNASTSRLRRMQTSTPITPHAASNEVSRERDSPSLRSRTAHGLEPYGRQSSRVSTPNTLNASEDEQDDLQILSPQSEVMRTSSFQGDASSTFESDSLIGSTAQSSWEAPGIAAATAGTLNLQTEAVNNRSDLQFPNRQGRPRPNAVNTGAIQDASLPSPSLSPVTAAANMQSRRSYFDRQVSSHVAGSSSTHQPSQDLQQIVISDQAVQTPADSQLRAVVDTPKDNVDVDHEVLSNTSIMKIPDMIDHFEAMPEEMKSYIMYQMLRRCSKPVLHFVADVVNPALKCDFLRLLPVELCLSIIGHLDVQSLCAAAQVSKRWRRLIDSSEKVWKHRFDADDYILQEGELPRAIREGWGWQYASQLTDFEKDLSTLPALPPNTDGSVSSAVHDGTGSTVVLASPQKFTSSLQNKRSKRKSKAKPKSTSRKQLKGRQDSTYPLELDDETILDMTSASEGPYAAASAAAAAVPYPGVGLYSLKNLHLFKSIYMRHHVIRKSWMNTEVAPRHIAFRAHQRHVVTCLQFDSDKILTGSDDSNINVYDTQTGALRAQLEGHEGGVWALQYEGNVLVSGSTDRSVRVWDIEHGICTQTFQGHTSTVRCLQILMPTSVGKTADGKDIMMPKQPLIITGSRDSNLRVWKLPKPGDPVFHQAGPAPDEASECPYFVRALLGHHHSVRAIAAHADTLVSGSYDCSVRVWKISTGELVHRLQGHQQKVYSVVLDHKRNRCISGSMDNIVRVWSLETGTPLHVLDGHSSLVGLLDLQQDRLVSAAADSTLRIWDPENGQCKSILTAHTGAITCFQHDGQKVISGSDRTLKMWDVTTGNFVKDLLTDLSGVWQVKFNARRCVAAVQRNNLTYIEVRIFSIIFALQGTNNILGPRFWRDARRRTQE